LRYEVMSSPENLSALACGLASEIVRTFGEVRLRVFGTSMVPSILPGDLISVQRTGLSEISLGEIAVYLRDGRLFAHRVVARVGGHDDPRLVTRGDRLSHHDPPISSSELLGRVISIQHGDELGYRKVRPAARLNGWGQIIVRVLASDRVTYLYLRLAKYWRSSFYRRTACQA
jgi:hypothetical protein